MATAATGDGGIPPRDAAARGLKRIMTLGGAYGTRNCTVKDLRALREVRISTWLKPKQRLVMDILDALLAQTSR